MTQKDELVCVGAIAGAHGVKGELRLRSFTQIPEDIFEYGPLLSDTADVLVEPVNARPAKNHFVVTCKTNKSREDWEALKGQRLHIRRADLPETEEDEFYYSDLLNLNVTHSDGRDLGRVKAVQNFGADDLLEIIAPDKTTAYYLPFTKAVVPVIRLSDKEIIADPEEALLPEDMQIETSENESE